MTTVINYNFFGQPTDSVFDDFKFRNPFADKKQKHPQKEARVIDVTAESRVLDDEENTIEVNLDKPVFAARLADPSMSYTTYNRQGKMVRHFDAKGVHVSVRV